MIGKTLRNGTRTLRLLILATAGLTVFGGPLASTGVAQNALDLTVTVAGVDSADGEVRVSLCGDRACFESHKGFLQELILPAQPGDMVVTFPGVAPGRYTLLSFHDADADGAFDRSWVGWPQEGFAISNDPSVGLSGPALEDAEIDVAPGRTAFRMRMRYW